MARSEKRWRKEVPFFFSPPVKCHDNYAKGIWEKSRNVGFRVRCTYRGLPVRPGSTTVDWGNAHDSLAKVDFVGTQENACYDVIRTGLESERRTKNASLDEGNDELVASEWLRMFIELWHTTQILLLLPLLLLLLLLLLLPLLLLLLVLLLLILHPSSFSSLSSLFYISSPPPFPYFPSPSPFSPFSSSSMELQSNSDLHLFKGLLPVSAVLWPLFPVLSCIF